MASFVGYSKLKLYCDLTHCFLSYEVKFREFIVMINIKSFKGLAQKGICVFGLGTIVKKQNPDFHFENRGFFLLLENEIKIPRFLLVFLCLKLIEARRLLSGCFRSLHRPNHK